jgi:hypothetical protein
LSFTKTLGTIIGAIVGVVISALLVHDSFQGVSIPTGATIALILLGTFLGSGLGAFIGSDDRGA